MAGTLSLAVKDLKITGSPNSDVVKVSSSAESILSYHNGSESGAELLCGSSPEEPPQEKSNVSVELGGCDPDRKSLDQVRKKLISKHSRHVFFTDLENGFIKMDPMEISKERMSVIQKLLVQINQLSDAEKLLLYLKLPSSTNSPFDPLRQPLNPLGNRQEIQQTIVWIKTHLEEDREISIPKQDVYEQYLKYCENVSMKPLSTADFGKVMKQVYPGVRPRRLGTRGNSRYCYSGMRNTCKLPAPVLPRLSSRETGDKLKDVTSSSGAKSMNCLETDKSKKCDKFKRKWKTSIGRCGKMRPSKMNSKENNAKRSKIDDSKSSEDCELTGIPDFPAAELETEASVKKEISHDSGNAFSAFDNISCDLGNDLSIYFANIDKVNDEKVEFGSKMDLELFARHSLTDPGGGSNLDDFNSKNNSTITSSSNNDCDDGEDEDDDDGDSSRKLTETELKPVPDELQHRKICNGRLTNGTTAIVVVNGLTVNSDTTEPINVSTNQVQFKSQRMKVRKSSNPIGKRAFKKSYVPIQPKPPVDGSVHLESNCKMRSEFPCEESDSQEPEEEIIRYFQHFEESKYVGRPCVIPSNQPKVRDAFLSDAVLVKDNSAAASAAAAVVIRSRSCFESQSGVSGRRPGPDFFVFPPRSQSSVEFSTGERRADGLSSLRMFLQQSSVSNESGCLESRERWRTPVKKVPVDVRSSIDGAVQKSDTRKKYTSNTGRVPPSPNSRTNFFNFTPISPGPGSPMKTPTTPLSSPFVSPRNTPAPRSRQSSLHGDHFVSPAIKAENLLDKGKWRFSNAGSTNPVRKEMQSNPPYRPRSNSSTNFYRAKMRRNISRVSDVSVTSTNCTEETGYVFPCENFAQEKDLCPPPESKAQQMQSETARSRSVPLSRTVSEGFWSPGDASYLYNQYLSGDSQGPTEGESESNPEEYDNFETKELEHLISSAQMPDLSADQVNQLLTRDGRSLSQSLSDQLLVGFESSDENPIRESVFSGKTDLNGNATFEDCCYPANFESSREDKIMTLTDVNPPLFRGGCDPIISSFKPSSDTSFSSCPASPVLEFFEPKQNEDNQLIEFLGLDG